MCGGEWVEAADGFQLAVGLNANDRMNIPDGPPIADDAATTSAELSEPLFFPVAVTKLVVLCICTLGIYEIYWFYKNWLIVKKRERTKINPAARSVLAVFFCYALFRRVGDSINGSGAGHLPAGLIAAGWIAACLLYKLPDPFGLLVWFLNILFLVPVQRAINRVNIIQAPDHEKNARFSKWNFATVAIGVFLIALAIFGSFLPPA